MDFRIGGRTLGGLGGGANTEFGQLDDPNPGPKSATWRLAHVVEVKPIPGKGKKFITIRTSDKYSLTSGVLWECDLVIRSITDDAYKFLKALCEDGGPFMVECNHGKLPMYIMDVSITHDENDKEKPLKADNGLPLNVATWNIKLQEAHD